METDDPYRPIVEPGPETGAAKPGRAWDLTANLWNGFFIAIFVVSLGIGAVTYGVLTPYGYWVGTPAKASVDRCELHGISSLESSPDLDCTGTWSVRGQSQTGPIKPPFRENEQNGIKAGKSVLDVRVHNGTAYTGLAVSREFYIAVAIGAALLIWGSLQLRKAWRAQNRR